MLAYKDFVAIYSCKLISCEREKRNYFDSTCSFIQ